MIYKCRSSQPYFKAASLSTRRAHRSFRPAMEAEGGDAIVTMEFSELEGMLRPILQEVMQVVRQSESSRRNSNAQCA